MIDTIDPEEGQSFWRQAEEHERQQMECEMRIQKFREAMAEVLEAEAKTDAALRQAIQDCIKAIDAASENLRREWP